MIRTEQLQMMFRAATAIGRDATVSRSEEGWRMSALDGAKVAMYDVLVPASAFPDGPGEGAFCILSQEGLSLVSMDREAEVTVDTDGGWFTVEAGGMRRSTRLLEPDPVRAMPDLDLDVGFMVDSDVFRSVAGIFDARRMQTLRVSASPEGLTLSVGDERDRASRTVPADAMVAPPDGTADTLYPLDYLQSMLKVVPRGRTVDVRMRDGMPMVVDFSGEGVAARCMLAPRVEED